MGHHTEKTLAPDIKGDAFAVLKKMEDILPVEDIWYLPLIGVDPVYQVKGLGAALMKAALIECDKVGLPAYLESSNQRNISLYERHGFEKMGEIQIGSSPVVTPMYRSAQHS